MNVTVSDDNYYVTHKSHARLSYVNTDFLYINKYGKGMFVHHSFFNQNQKETWNFLNLCLPISRGGRDIDKSKLFWFFFFFINVTSKQSYYVLNSKVSQMSGHCGEPRSPMS